MWLNRIEMSSLKYIIHLMILYRWIGVCSIYGNHVLQCLYRLNNLSLFNLLMHSHSPWPLAQNVNTVAVIVMLAKFKNNFPFSFV